MVYNFSNESFLDVWVPQREDSAGTRAAVLRAMLGEMLCPGLAVGTAAAWSRASPRKRTCRLVF